MSKVKKNVLILIQLQICRNELQLISNTVDLTELDPYNYGELVSVFHKLTIKLRRVGGTNV